ncbi:MAG: PEP-CTERM sorting domain-containing protein [Gammaproteobacteria bacterium]|nr:PEP-CTERM sorting domain-containing protein [Gammaproteobacteria bacterium]
MLTTGPVVETHGAALGLADDFFSGLFDNMNALSYGRDPIRNPLLFSVDRVAIGAPGTAVAAEAAPGLEDAAGDVFQANPPFFSNIKRIDESALFLTGGFFGDDLNALDVDRRRPRGGFEFVYFSVDDLSFNGVHAPDVLISPLPGGPFSVFADGIVDIGLLPGDDLDALVLADGGVIGELDAGDRALFSISAFSTSSIFLGGSWSPADVLFTDFSGSFSLFASAASIGLRVDDELDALDTIPEPTTLALLGLGMLGVWARRRR